MTYYLYLLASQRNGTLYVGVTNNLESRICEHKEGMIDGFTKKHGISMLVYFEEFDNITSAIAREKAIKKWNRAWKIDIIEQMNPEWKDLARE